MFNSFRPQHRGPRYSTSGVGSKQPATGVDASPGKRTPEKVEDARKDCNARGLADEGGQTAWRGREPHPAHLLSVIP